MRRSLLLGARHLDGGDPGAGARTVGVGDRDLDGVRARREQRLAVEEDLALAGVRDLVSDGR